MKTNKMITMTIDSSWTMTKVSEISIVGDQIRWDGFAVKGEAEPMVYFPGEGFMPNNAVEFHGYAPRLVFPEN